MVKYAKCPRCELNYIDTEKQQYCDVCIKEMKGLDDEPFYSEEEDEELMELCPRCGENMMRSGETMCEECKKKTEYEEEEDVDVDMESDEEWRNYLDDETEEPDDLGLGEEFGAEFDGDDEEEEDEEYHGDDEEDDFEYVTGDDIYKYSDDDDDDDDDEDDDDDDDDESPKDRRKKSDDDDF